MANRFVKVGGSNLLDGTTTGNAWETAIYGFTNVGASNTLKFLTGTYDIDRSSLYTPIPSGTSGNPTIITDNADGQVTFNHPGTGNAGMIFFSPPQHGSTVRSPTPEYISFIGTSPYSIKFDGEDVDTGFTVYHGTSLVNHIIWENIEFTRCPAGSVGGYDTSDVTFDRCYFYKNYSIDDPDIPQSHALYLCGDRFRVVGCVFEDNLGWGLHCYSSSGSNFDDQYIVGNIAFKNGFGQRSNSTGAGLLVNEGSGIIANNVCYGNAGPGIQVWRAHDLLIAHNSCHDNGTGGIEVGRTTGTTSNISIKNNICIDNGGPPIKLYASCTGTVATWNRLGSGESMDTSGDSGGTYNNNVASGVAIDEWVNPEDEILASRDYSLKAGADSIWNASTNNVPSVGISTDIEGTSRVHPDQGAYAFGTPDPPEPPVIGHLANYAVGYTEAAIALTLFDNDSNTLTFTIVSTGNTALRLGDTTNCTVDVVS